MLNISLNLAGRFRLKKIKKGRDVYVGEWFKNIITDNGLNLIPNSDTKFWYCCAGAGSDTPLNTDIAIQSFLGGSPASTGGDEGLNTSENYSYIRKVYQFDVGAVVGNVSELTIGPNANGSNIFSRSLVKDQQGVPTSISVLADEQLIVEWEYRVYQPVTDFSGSVDGFSYVMRACNINSPFFWGSLSSQLQYVTSSGNSQNTASAFVGGSLGSVSSAPSGTRFDRSQITVAGYVTNSFSLSASISWNPSSFSGEVTCFRYSLTSGFGTWQFSIDPGINKTLDDKVEVDVSISWSRDL